MPAIPTTTPPLRTAAGLAVVDAKADAPTSGELRVRTGELTVWLKVPGRVAEGAAPPLRTDVKPGVLRGPPEVSGWAPFVAKIRRIRSGDDRSGFRSGDPDLDRFFARFSIMCAFKYVAAHDLAHLVHRNQGEAFWQTLATALPDGRVGKAALERWETGRRAL